MGAPRMQPSFEALDRPGGYTRVGLLRPLRASRDFRVLWAGMTVSLIGDGIFLIAIAWTAFKLWNAPAALSVIGIAMTVPTIVCLLAGGAVSDRFDRRLVLVASDLARAAAVALLAGLAMADSLTFPLLAVLAAAYSAAGAFFTPAFEAIVPSVVAEDDLAAANSLDQFVRPLALRLVGPALGGLVVAQFGFALRSLSMLRHSPRRRLRSSRFALRCNLAVGAARQSPRSEKASTSSGAASGSGGL